MKSRDDTVIKKDRSAINKSLKRAETFVAQSTRTSVFSNSYQEEEATHNKVMPVNTFQFIALSALALEQPGIFINS